MSSGGGRKRGHGAVSDGTDASVSRLTKQRKPPPAPPSAEPRPLCLLDLPAGIVAGIAQFIDIDEADDEGNSCAGEILMYLCLVFGRQTARVIRREYLRNNLLYLDYFSQEVVYYSNQSLCTEKDYRIKCISILNGALKQWMQENKWWKDACRYAAVFAKGGDVCKKYPPIYKTKEIKIANDEERNRWRDELGTNASDFVDLHFEGGPLGDDYTVILAVDDIDLFNHKREMAWEQVEEAVLKEGDKMLRLMHNIFAAIFFNPAFAIDLGMFELFRFQVEDLMLDVNCQDYCGLFFASPGDDEEFEAGQSLLLHALLNPDKRFFDFLLSVANFEANPVIQRDLKDGRNIRNRADTFLHRLPHILRCDLPKKIDLDWVAQLIKVKEVDLDIENNFESMTPLEEVCGIWPQRKSDGDVAKMLLSAGAEVTRAALSLARSNVTSESSEFSREQVFLQLLESYKEYNS